MTIDELKARKRELMARKKYELELQERGEGDNFALFMVNEELLDVNAQLRAIVPAGKRVHFGRKGRASSSLDAYAQNSGDRQQFIKWARADVDDAAEEARAELRKMLHGGMKSVTGRQREILLLYADGLTETAIGAKLGVHKSTRCIRNIAKHCNRHNKSYIYSPSDNQRLSVKSFPDYNAFLFKYAYNKPY